MSKEIKEKCKECVYYNEKQQYPDVEGATTHLNCLSLKCQYRKVTKDVKIKRLTSKIADLEAKLAESEKEADKYWEFFNQEAKECAELKEQLAKEQKHISRLKNMNKSHDEAVGRLTEENNQLKQQLTEKEQTIEEINKEFVQAVKDWKSLVEQKEKEIESLKHFKISIGTMENNQVDISSTTYIDQDKISFCIEQLELLKQKMANFDLPNNPKLYNNDMFCGGFDSHYVKTKEQIDNQIEELKKGCEQK